MSAPFSAIRTSLTQRNKKLLILFSLSILADWNRPIEWLREATQLMW